MVKASFFITVSLVVLVVLVSCSPGAVPSPAPTVASPPVTATVQTQAAPTLSPEEAAWQETLKTAQKQGKVTVYANLTPDLVTSLTIDFQRAYGIKLEIINGTAAVHYERIKTEKRVGLNIVDIYEATSQFTVLANQEGLLGDFGELPVLKEKGVWDVNPVIVPQRIVYMYPLLTTSWINTKLVAPAQEPKSYMDLLQPRWKGKMVIGDPTSTPNASRLYVILIKNKILNEEHFKDLGKQEIKFSPTVRESLSMIARGDIELTMSDATSTAIPLIVEGAPIKPIAYKEGVTVSHTSNGIVKSSTHPEAARVFLNWFFSQQGQTIVAKAIGRSVRKDVPDFTPPAARIDAPLLEESVQDMAEISRLQTERVLWNMWKK